MRNYPHKQKIIVVGLSFLLCSPFAYPWGIAAPTTDNNAEQEFAEQTDQLRQIRDSMHERISDDLVYRPNTPRTDPGSQSIAESLEEPSKPPYYIRMIAYAGRFSPYDFSEQPKHPHISDRGIVDQPRDDGMHRVLSLTAEHGSKEDANLNWILNHGTAAGKIYACLLIQNYDPARGERELKRLLTKDNDRNYYINRAIAKEFQLKADPALKVTAAPEPT